MNIEQEIAREVLEYVPGADGEADSRTIAAAIMPLVRRAQASKVREIADRALDPRDGIPFDAEHDLAIVSAWLDEEATRIEQNSEGNET